MPSRLCSVGSAMSFVNSNSSACAGVPVWQWRQPLAQGLGIKALCLSASQGRETKGGPTAAAASVVSHYEYNIHQ